MILKKTILLALLVLVAAASATETTWKHSGFEVWGYDINFTGQYNVTEVRTLEFALNSSAPPLSGTDRAVVYYGSDDKLKVSENGGAYSNLGGGVTLNEVNASGQFGSSVQVTGLQGQQDAQNTSITNIESVNTEQNTSINSIQTVNVNQNTSVTNIESVNTNQNASITNIEAVNINQNNSITNLEGVNTAQNTSINGINSTKVNKSDAGELSGGTVQLARIGLDAPNTDEYLRGDNYWSPITMAQVVDLLSNLNLKTNKTDVGEFTGGTFADARLSANVPLLDASNNFTNNNRFSSNIGIKTNASANYGISIVGSGVNSGIIMTNTGGTVYGIVYPVSMFGEEALALVVYDTDVYYDVLVAGPAADLADLRTGADGIFAATKFVGATTTTGFDGNGSALTALNAGNLASGTVPASILGTNLNTSSANFIIDGGGSAITVANYGMIKPNVTGVIKYVALMSELQGNITISLLGDNNGVNSAPPTVVLGGPWTISNGYGYENGSLNIAVSDTTRLRYNVSSGDTIQRVTVIAPIQKS